MQEIRLDPKAVTGVIQALYGGVRVGALELGQYNVLGLRMHEKAHRCSDFWKAENDDFS